MRGQLDSDIRTTRPHELDDMRQIVRQAVGLGRQEDLKYFQVLDW